MKSHGATCRNWITSWSYVNEKDKVIIFGAWDRDTQGTRSLIFSEKWQATSKGRKNYGYKESRENIRLIEEEGYQLQTFPMIYSDAKRDAKGIGPATIKGFTPKLTTKILKKIGSDWYAQRSRIVSHLFKT
jgi:5-methylcytosine-specific restriction protein A